MLRPCREPLYVDRVSPFDCVWAWACLPLCVRLSACPHSRHHASGQSISTLCSDNIATQQLSSAFANNLNCHPQNKSLYLHRFPATSPCPHPPSNRARKEVCISPPAPPAAETAAAEPQQEQGKGSAAASSRQQQLITSQAGPVLTTSAQLGRQGYGPSHRQPVGVCHPSARARLHQYVPTLSRRAQLLQRASAVCLS